MSELVVSLTTIPPRVGHLRLLLESLRNQTLRPDRVELNLPHEYKKREFSNAELRGIPQDFDIFRCDDVGPATKLLPTLRRHRGKDTTIVYCDDDRHYANNWLERLVAMAQRNADSAIADECLPIRNVIHSYIGIKKDWIYRVKRGLSFGLYHPYYFDSTLEPDIAEGFGGVLVKSDFFSDRVFEIPNECWAVDDIWFSANIRLTERGIIRLPRKSTERSLPIRVGGQDIGRTEDSLTLTKIDGLSREQLNYRALEYCIDNLGVWQEFSRQLPTKSGFGPKN